MDLGEYCRAIEAHLTSVSGGHLVRIVGPGFDLVRGWEARGIPIKAVYRGIDRYAERHEAKEGRRSGVPEDRAPRRRPVRIEFCEADVLDVFDEWRRAVGLTGSSGSAGSPGEDTGTASRKKESLAAHLERVVARLTALRGGTERRLDPILDETVRELDAARASAKGLRGEGRQALLDRLRVLEQQLTAAARGALPASDLDTLGREADAELAPFRDRMPADTYQQSREACIDRLVRERTRLPVISLDA
jgi:hypothetical protein